MALLPFVKIPTNTSEIGNTSVEGGLIVPLTVHLPAGFEVAMETEIDDNRNSDNDGRHAEWVNSISLGHDLIPERLSGYIEFWSDLSGERHQSWMGTFDTGLQYTLTKNILLDIGVNLGLTRNAPDVEVFTGISLRF